MVEVTAEAPAAMAQVMEEATVVAKVAEGGKLARKFTVRALALTTVTAYTISTGLAADPKRGEKEYLARYETPDVYDPTVPRYGRRITQPENVELNLCDTYTSSGGNGNDNGGYSGGNGGSSGGGDGGGPEGGGK